MIDDAFFSWAAGLFEGEGLIRIHRTPRDVFGLNCRVAMTDFQAVRLFWKRWGGSTRTQQHKLKNRRPLLYWDVVASVASRFLSDILPYLRTDRVRAKAILALEFQAGRKGKGFPRSPEQIEQERAMVAQMMVLNHRGARTQ